MTYQEATDYLFAQLPAFERGGASDYKPGLDTTLRLAEAFGSPHLKLKVVHIAGTNGKGSTAAMTAAALTAAGLRTGLYTSPHLVDFRERMRVDGRMVPGQWVCGFVERYLAMEPSGLRPTFFELTTVMVLAWFAEQQVDVAVLETGLGGRLDATNIVPSPLVTAITSIGLDHTDLLGHTLGAVAHEKCGIMKPGVPMVYPKDMPAEVTATVEREAGSHGAMLRPVAPRSPRQEADGRWSVVSPWRRRLTSPMPGPWQAQNLAVALGILQELELRGVEAGYEATARALAHLEELTGLTGRWTVTGHRPLRVYDTGHNPDAWRLLAPLIGSHDGHQRLVLGFVADKDVNAIVALIARHAPAATLYLAAPGSRRALPAADLADICRRHGLECRTYAGVNQAWEAALADAAEDDLVFLGGSNYLVGEWLQGR